MTIKNLFKASVSSKSLINKSAAQIGDEIESVNYLEADIERDNRFIPAIDYSKPENFAKYGSAKQYYAKSIENIYKTYPYDGSLYERIDWQNSSSYIDLYILENEYPRRNGYITFSFPSWGTPNGGISYANDWYGYPASPEYISIFGGPGTGGGPQSQGANIWDVDANRQSNLELNVISGSTVEFWLKHGIFDKTLTQKEVIFDLWNNELSSSDSYGRFRIELSASDDDHAGANPILLTLQSGTYGFRHLPIANSSFTTASITDDKWHHYAVSVKSASLGVTTRFYVDGELNNEITTGSFMIGHDGTEGVGVISGSMLAYIGALRTNLSGPMFQADIVGYEMSGSGKLSGSLDEFRYWKTQRSSEDIGRYWFTQVGGGTNTDPANTDLGVYYKFNEGITRNAATDSTVLDYSGRVTNGNWVGYYSSGRGTEADPYYSSRFTGSAIVESSASATEFKDPIVYYFHPAVIATSAKLESSGSVYDFSNNASLFHSFPSWMTEEDEEAGHGLLNLTQIIGSYFDSLHLQIESLNKLQDVEYVSGSDKPNIFGARLLENRGLLAPELFFDADVLEKLADRSEEKLFIQSLTDTKNLIYKNIYANLINIYKSKGTYKSFRNLIRCFGIDEEILKLNMYGNNVDYKIRTNRTNVDTKERFIDFVSVQNQSATIFQTSSVSDANTVNYISGSIRLTGGYASTLETEILFPQKLPFESPLYAAQDYAYLSSSLFGIHTAFDSPDPLAWEENDNCSFQVYAVRDEKYSKNVRFLLTSSGPSQIFVEASSSVYDEVYTDSKWNFAVRVKPSKYPWPSFAIGIGAEPLDPTPIDTEYIIELHGIQTEADVILNEFTISSSIDPKSAGMGFITGSKRVYAGAHRQNYTGSLLTPTDVKIGNCRYWLDYLTDETLQAHAYDIKNYGALHPQKNTYLFQGAGPLYDDVQQTGLAKIQVPQIDTLLLNWDFGQVTGSDSSGEFFVADFSSGSTGLTTSRYGWMGPILNAQHSGLGYGFAASSAKIVDVDYVISARQNLPENLYSEDMISVLREDDVAFTRDSRPITFFFAFEKSMYRSISEEIVNMFASIVDFNNLVGNPVNKYRDRYKELEKLRNIFFERVQNTPDLNKYIEYYKWFDSSLGTMLQQLVPASADFSEKIRTVVESHILERSKYQHKFPTLEMKLGEIEGIVESPLPLSPGWVNDHHPTDDLEKKNASWWKYRAERNVGKLSSSTPGLNADRNSILEVQKKTRITIKRQPYRFKTNFLETTTGPIVRPIHAGTNHFVNKRRNMVYEICYPAGPLMSGNNVPQNVMVAFEGNIEKARDIVDEVVPYKKHRLNFKLDPDINRPSPEFYTADGDLFAPFNLYSSSLGVTTTGYNSEVVNRFSDRVEITNLHVDSYHDTGETPIQGPFSDRFVGGRQHRHIELNKFDSSKPGLNNLDSPEDRPEGFKLLLGWCVEDSGALGVVDPQYPDPDSPYVVPPYLFDRPKANLLRGQTIKRPVNIANILMTSASTKQRLSGALHHGPIGNYQKNYQIVQSNGRSTNDLFFRKQTFNFAANPRLPYFRRIGNRLPLEPDNGPGNNFTLPNRVGIDSNDTIFVNKFSSPGGYAEQSRGYLDPAHEEYSAYNVLTYRNMEVRGLVGQAETDEDLGTDESQKLVVIDYLGKKRGLDPLLTLHAGKFGIDADFGSLSAATYPDKPAFHKVNRNPKMRMELSDGVDKTGTVYDNWWVQHQIPRSDRQYAWISASLLTDNKLFGYTQQTGTLISSLPLISSSLPRGADVGNVVIDFNGLNTYIYEPITSSRSMLGWRNREVGYASSPYWRSIDSYRNTDIDTMYARDIFNSLMLHRNGPYGWPSWKQIRTGEHPIRRYQQRNNIMGLANAPTAIRTPIGIEGYGDFKGSNTLYIEPPISSEHPPMEHILASDNKYFDKDRKIKSKRQTLVLKHDFGNKIEKFANMEINNRLGLKYQTNRGDLYFNRINSILLQDIAGSGSPSPFENIEKVMINYSQRVFPASKYTYLNKTRSRTVFTIDKVWNEQRGRRSKKTGVENSMGHLMISASVWPLDAHSQYTKYANFGLGWPSGTPSHTPTYGNPSNGAGELQNKYSRFGMPHLELGCTGSLDAAGYGITASCLYAYPVLMGSGSSPGISDTTCIYGGDTYWDAPSQAGKFPYQPYEEFAKYIRLIGKEYSLVPEFRISEHMERYVNYHNSDFLANNDGFLTLTGSTITIASSEPQGEDDDGNMIYADVDTVYPATSEQENFFEEYATSDFLKLFEIVDEPYEGKRLINDDILHKDSLTLKCTALLKFLPYKGFYPAERGVELARIFSQSYGDFVQVQSLRNGATYATPPHPAAFRTLVEPLFAPGILFNTIKSGIAVSNFAVSNTSSVPDDDISTPHDSNNNAIFGSRGIMTEDTQLPEGVVSFGKHASSSLNLLESDANNLRNQGGYEFKYVPFEALIKPAKYLSRVNTTDGTSGGSLAGNSSEQWLYDTGLRPAAAMQQSFWGRNRVSWTGEGSKLYELAIDNFLCETINFFQDEMVNFVSSREEEFNVVKSGSVYSMTIKIKRPTEISGNTTFGLEPDRSRFEMYNRQSAFGPPFSGKRSATSFEGGQICSASFAPLTPPYTEGSASVTIVYKATQNGKPSLDDILSTSDYIYERKSPMYGTYGISSGHTWRMMISSSVNIDDKIVEVVPGTTGTKERWLIQSKFETPVLNFADAQITLPATGSQEAIVSRGMWHQYGSLISGSQAGVTIGIESPKYIVGYPLRTDVTEVQPLADIVGFNSSAPKLIGTPKKVGKLEEAVIAIPFIPCNDGRRKFFKINKNQVKAALGGKGKTVPTESVKDLVSAMKKYLFPPKFDFVTNRNVDPIAMYVFEFGITLQQQDYADMWQNLPPTAPEEFASSTFTTTHRLLAEEFFNNNNKKISSKIRWLIFKVKKKAEKDYNRFKKKGLVPHLSSITSNIDSAYSYNWPYDYFSLVELIKMNTTIQYASSKAPDSTVKLTNDVIKVELINPAGELGEDN